MGAGELRPGFAGLPSHPIIFGAPAKLAAADQWSAKRAARTVAGLHPQKRQAARLAQRRPKYLPRITPLAVSNCGVQEHLGWGRQIFLPDVGLYCVALSILQRHLSSTRLIGRHALGIGIWSRPPFTLLQRSSTVQCALRATYYVPRTRAVYLSWRSSCEPGYVWAGRWRSSQAPQKGGRRPGRCGQAGPKGRLPPSGSDIPRSAGTGLKPASSQQSVGTA